MMNQREVVIKVMEENNGYATLSYLYENALIIPNVIWKTKTPFASIRRIVQNEKYFFKIKPGLWALKSHQNRLPAEVTNLIEKNKIKPEKVNVSVHSLYQGLIVEIGKMEGFKTYIPPQDHNKIFPAKAVYLKEIIDFNTILDFTHNDIIQIVKYIDVFWFNKRKLPDSIFEIDHTTDFRSSLLKFMELRDFNVKMFIISSNVRKGNFINKISRPVFEPIRNRVKFLSYNYVSEKHSKATELKIIEKMHNNLNR